ncbi:MAG: hypothetical protein LAT68_06995 [Cyclobacteriaceae bacterium]|nr:hypothetical protein [Cyclobacteriaceae bacterium]MCH8516060.1 hypothetical protein [Cyclobacteriaceae bacterium]
MKRLSLFIPVVLFTFLFFSCDDNVNDVDPDCFVSSSISWRVDGEQQLNNTTVTNQFQDDEDRFISITNLGTWAIRFKSDDFEIIFNEFDQVFTDDEFLEFTEEEEWREALALIASYDVIELSQSDFTILTDSGRVELVGTEHILSGEASLTTEKVGDCGYFLLSIDTQIQYQGKVFENEVRARLPYTFQGRVNFSF